MEYSFYTITGTVAHYSKGQFLKSTLIHDYVLQSYFHAEEKLCKSFSLILKNEDCFISNFYLIDPLENDNSIELKMFKMKFIEFLEDKYKEDVNDTLECKLDFKKEKDLLKDPLLLSDNIREQIVSFLRF